MAAADDAQIPVAIGILVGLLASFVQALGLTIQRKSHVLNQQLPPELQRVEHRRPLWLLGFGIFISSNIFGSVVQIAALPVVILAPLGAVSLLWNAFFARFILGDVFSPWMILGTAFIAGGAGLIAEFGVVPETSHSLEDLLLLFRRPAFIAYFSLLGAAVLVCLVITHATDYSLSKRTASPFTSPPFSPHHRSPTFPIAPLPPTGISSNRVSESTPLLDRKSAGTRSSTPLPFNTDRAADRTRLFIAIAYASVSGILSGMCLIFAKSGVELLVLTIRGRNQFWRWEPWVLVLGLVVFALLQLWYLHKALIYADPTIVCPLAFCFYNISSIVNGLIYFDQVALLSTLSLCLVGLGMTVLLVGVWTVSIHAGAGRVDVGTWQEGDDELGDEEMDVQDRDLAHLEVEGHPHRPSSSSPLQSPEEPANRPALGNPRLSLSLHGVVKFPSAGNAEEEITSPRYSSTSAALHSSDSATPHSKHPRTHRFSMLHSPEAAVPAGGLSIGLSPVSPGFAIVPKRRTSGLKGVVRRAVMRRAVSESDAHASAIDAEHQSALADSDDTLAEQRQEGKAARKSEARWKWLRQIFTTRDA